VITMGKRVSFTTKGGKKVSFISKAKKAGSTIKRRVKHRSKSIKRRTRSRSPVAKHKKSSGKRRPGKKSFIDRIPILNNPTVQKVGFGLGMGTLAVSLINLAARFAPPAIAQPLVQNQRIIKLGVEAATEPISAIVDLVLPSVMNTGNGGGNGMSMGNQVGFA